MKITDSSITVRDIRIFAYHGVYEHERSNGNEFSVDITLNFDAQCAMRFDDLENTVNYAEVIDIVANIMAVPSDLLEHVAYRIIAAIVEAFPIVSGGSVSVTKIHPPVSVPNGGATFSASFTV